MLKWMISINVPFWKRIPELKGYYVVDMAIKLDTFCKDFLY